MTEQAYVPPAAATGQQVDGDRGRDLGPTQADGSAVEVGLGMVLVVATEPFDLVAEAVGLGFQGEDLLDACEVQS